MYLSSNTNVLWPTFSLLWWLLPDVSTAPSTTWIKCYSLINVLSTVSFHSDTDVFNICYGHTGCNYFTSFQIRFNQLWFCFETGSCHVAQVQVGLEFLILLPPPSKCWDYRVCATSSSSSQPPFNLHLTAKAPQIPLKYPANTEFDFPGTCPTFWISSFLLGTFTSDSHTLNGPSLQFLDQRHPWYTILLDANPALLLHLVSISAHLPILVETVLPSRRLDLGVLYHQCLTHYFEYSNGFTNYWLTDKEVSSFKPESREREVESTAQTLSVTWVTEMAGRPQDCTGSFSRHWDQILQEHLREVYSGPQRRRRSACSHLAGQQAEKEECWCSAGFLLSYFIQLHNP